MGPRTAKGDMLLRAPRLRARARLERRGQRGLALLAQSVRARLAGGGGGRLTDDAVVCGPAETRRGARRRVGGSGPACTGGRGRRRRRTRRRARGTAGRARRAASASAPGPARRPTPLRARARAGPSSRTACTPASRRARRRRRASGRRRRRRRRLRRARRRRRPSGRLRRRRRRGATPPCARGRGVAGVRGGVRAGDVGPPGPPLSRSPDGEC